MAGLLVGLELLSTLNEKDECLTLLEILSYRDNKLTDLEIWAVCRECCIALKSVYNSPSMFQTLCITPDTVGFNIDGSVCFLDLGKDPESLYVPPEYDSLGNSTKGHMFSLGMTILYAAVYSSVAEPQTSLDPAVNRMILAMTDDNYDNRPDVDEVLATCEENLASCSVTSLKVCQWLISAAKDVFVKLNNLDCSDGELRSRSATPDSQHAKNRSPGSTDTKSASPLSLSDSSIQNSSPACDIIRPPERYCDIRSASGPDPERAVFDGLATPGRSEVADAASPSRSDVIRSRERPLANDKERGADSPADNGQADRNSRPSLTNGYFSDDDASKRAPSRDDNRRDDGDVMRDGRPVTSGWCASGDSAAEDDTGARSGGEQRRRTNGAENCIFDVGDFNADGRAEVVSSATNAVSESPSGKHTSVAGQRTHSGAEEQESSSPSSSAGAVRADIGAASDFHSDRDTLRTESGYDPERDRHRAASGRMGNEASSDETADNPVGPDAGTGSEVGSGTGSGLEPGQTTVKSPDLSTLSPECKSTGNVSTTADHKDDASSQDDKNAQLVIDVLKNIGALSENELWALCRECMLALLGCKGQLPIYISLDTVAIETDGHVTFHSMPEGLELDHLFVAPELEEFGVVTDKACLYSISAMLWSAADYNLPSSEEPALSEELESLLASMIQEDVDRRPEIFTVLETCNHYQDIHGLHSEETCAILLAESKAAAYSKENTFILDVISQELEKKTLQHHAKVMESIKLAKVMLKPVSERQLADRPTEDSLHDLLMKEIHSRYPLRKVGKPKESTARELYDRNPELLSSLVHVTRRGRPKSFDNADSAFTVITKSVPKADQEVNASVNGEASVPNEYRSTATHFTPIEISNRRNSKPQLKLKPQLLGHKQGPSQKTNEIVKNIQEMKRNIQRINESRTLVQDLERDVQREESGSAGCDASSETDAKQPPSQRSSSTSTSTVPSASGTSQEDSSQKQQSPGIGQPCTVPLTLHPTVFPVQYQLQQDPVTGLVNLVPVGFTQNMASLSNPYLAGQMQQMFPMMGMQMTVPGTMMPGQFVNYPATSSIGIRPQTASRHGSCHESPKPQTPSQHANSEPDITERSAPRSQSASQLNVEVPQGSGYVNSSPPTEMPRAEYPFGNNHPVRPRQVKAKDQLAKLKRAKSGSSIDYYKAVNGEGINSRTDTRHGDSEQKTCVQDRATRRKRYSGGLSPDIPSSPSPSPSKDSGICGLNTRGFGDPALMEKLLNSNRKLSKVIHLIRDEFAFDGYMENGVEDLAVAEYVMSLANLSLNTFCDAITEKYSNLFWDEGLLLNLYEVVNEEKSTQESRHLDPIISAEPSLDELDVQNNNNRQSFGSKHSETTITKTLKFNESDDSTETSGANYPKPRWVMNKQRASPQGDPRQKWTSQWRSLDQSKSTEFVSGRDLSNATYLHNSCLDDASLRYSMPSIHARCSPQDEGTSTTADDSNQGGSSKPICTSATDLHSESVHDLDQHIQHGTYKIVRTTDPANRRSNSLVNINRLNLYENRSWREHDQPRPLTSRPRSMMSRSSINLRSSTDTDVDAPIPESPSEDVQMEKSVRIRRSEVAYYHADVDDCFKEKIRDYLSLQESPTACILERCLYKIDQELMLQHRNRQKSLNYFLRLVEFSGKTGKVSDQKPILQKTTEELEKCQNRITYLDAVRKYVEMMYCEQWSLSTDLLGALAKCSSNSPMLLAPGDNTLLQFQTTTPDGRQIKVLQAGLPLGLMAYLYAEGALSDGYIHEFFYCYRYFVSPVDLLEFIISKYEAAVMSLSPESQIPLKVKSRSLDLLYIWLDGYFRIDFENSPTMMKLVEEFVEKRLSPSDPCSSDLMLLLEDCKDGCHVDLVFSSNTPKVCDIKENEITAKNTNVPRKTLRANLVNHPLEDEWKSFKAALQLSTKTMKLQKLTRSQSVACVDRMNGMTRPLQSMSSERTRVRHSDGIVLMDYSPQLLAEQLTLMEQELFQKSHPIHYLNSKAQGIGVDLTGPITRRAQSVTRLSADCEHNADNLFVGNHTLDDVIHVLIEHAQGIAFWVASEVINCKSSKVQVSLLCHLINTAKVCAELRNFATSLSILDGLQNPLVKLLPTWRSVPSKYRRMLDQLMSVQLSIKSNGLYLISDINTGRCPTIPSVLLFLLHIQREEVGGYTLANSMYKWSKMRSIARMVDQIRRFQQTMYDFQPDRVIQDIIHYRMETFGGQDLTWVAAEQAQALHTAKRKTTNVFQRMRQNFQAKKN